MFFTEPISVSEFAESGAGLAGTNHTTFVGRLEVRGKRRTAGEVIRAEISAGVSELCNAISTGNERLVKGIKGIGKMTAQRIIVDLRDKIVALGIADEIPAGGAMAAPVNNAVRDEAVAALTMLGFAPAPTQKVVVGILSEQPDLPVEQVVKLALKQIK